MEWLNERYPKASKLDDYGMYGREFPPEVIEYVHAHWIRVGDVYTKPDVIVKHKNDIVNFRDDIRLTVLTPEEAERRVIPLEPQSVPSEPVQLDAANKEALKVLAEKGPEKAADFMMSMAGGDYARMRSMYG
jgi:hypothetical protein